MLFLNYDNNSKLNSIRNDHYDPLLAKACHRIKRHISTLHLTINKINYGLNRIKN